MWSIQYVLYFKITHPLFKKQSQICSKLHHFSWKKTTEICSRQNVHHLNTDTKNLVLVLTKKGGRIRSYSQFLKRNSYPHLKKLKLGPKILFFLIKHEDICNYNPWCFMYGGLMLDRIIMNLFSDSAKNIQWKIIYFPK